MQDAFTPKHVQSLEGRIARLCDGLAQTLAERPDGEAELLHDFAEPIPVTVIAELLGVPDSDRYRLAPWSKAIIEMFEPERSPEMEQSAVEAAQEFADYVRVLIQQKRVNPRGDLISRMVRLHDTDPERLSEAEIVANAILFLDAGHEAVVNVVGNGVVALLSRPEVWRQLCEKPRAYRNGGRGSDALRHAATVF